jgi:hypothetical protein
MLIVKLWADKWQFSISKTSLLKNSSFISSWGPRVRLRQVE